MRFSVLDFVSPEIYTSVCKRRATNTYTSYRSTKDLQVVLQPRVSYSARGISRESVGIEICVSTIILRRLSGGVVDVPFSSALLIQL
jgi:hypothetical protein